MSDSPFEILMQVQDLDTSIAQLTHRKAVLDERLELQAVEAQLATIASRTVEAEGEMTILAGRLSELEEQLAVVNERRTALEGRMYADRGSAARAICRPWTSKSITWPSDKPRSKKPNSKS